MIGEDQRASRSTRPPICFWEDALDGLEGKVVIVAGAALGLGAATASKLAAHGAHVIVADIDHAGAEATAGKIVEAGGSAVAARFDITDDASVQELFASTAGKFGKIDGLHNNVADLSLIPKDVALAELDPDVWDRTMSIDLKSYYTTLRHVIPYMLRQGGGAIVNTSSASAFLGEPVRPAYSAAKAAIGALTRHVATAYGRQGVRCNAVAPGLVATERSIEIAKAVDGDPDYWFEQIRNTCAHSHRDGRPSDIASMVALLVSEEGSWINGQVLNVDGGWVLR